VSVALLPLNLQLGQRDEYDVNVNISKNKIDLKTQKKFSEDLLLFFLKSCTKIPDLSQAWW
jgi:hypothetical protein